MGHQRNYSWEFKLQMVQLLEKGEQNPSQISRDHHVTRSLLYVWWQLYRERGEAAFCLHRPSKVLQKWIDRRMRKNTLPTWSDCVDNRPSNWICCDRRWMS